VFVLSDGGETVIPLVGVPQTHTSWFFCPRFWPVFSMAGFSAMTMMILGPRGPKLNVNPRKTMQKPPDRIEKDQGVRCFMVVPTGIEPVSLA
jgi:hypothetical protein